MRIRVLVAIILVSITSSCSDDSVAVQERFTEQLSSPVQELVRAAAQRTKERPDGADAWGYYGYVLLANKLTAPAASVFERAHELQPKNAEWAANLATIYMEESRLVEAEIAVSKAAEAAPQNARLLFLGGRIFEELGRYEQAVAAMETVMELVPGSYAADFAKGRILLNQGRYRDAKLFLERAMRNAPRSAQIRSSLVRLAAASPGLDVAIPPEASATNDDPVIMPLPFSEKLLPHIRRLDALQESIAVFMSTNDEARTEEFLGRLTSWYPEHATPQEWVDFAHLQAKRGDPAAAEATYRNCLKFHPDAANAHLGLADLMFMKNDLDGARRHYGSAGKFAVLPRQEARFQQGIGRLAARGGNLSGALESMQAAEALWPESGIIQMDLVLILADMSRFKEAAEHLQRSEELGFPVTAKFKRRLNAARDRQAQQRH